MTAAHSVTSTTKHVAQHSAVANTDAAKVAAKTAKTAKKAALKSVPTTIVIDNAVITVPRQTRGDRRAAKKAAKIEVDGIITRAKEAASRQWDATHRVIDGQAVRVTTTGKAMFSVDKAGEVTGNIASSTANGLETVAVSAEKLADQVFPTSFLAQLFESDVQRTRRVNVQSVVTTLQLAAVGAKFIAKHVK